MKTRNGWDKSGKDLMEYLVIGDVVDEELMMYLAEVVPAEYMTRTVVQCGEAWSRGECGLTYATVKKTAKGWVFCGTCYSGKTEHVPSICAKR